MIGMSAFAIQKMMRHKNINVTMRYVAMWGNELKEQNDKHIRLNNLDLQIRGGDMLLFFVLKKVLVYEENHNVTIHLGELQ